MSAATGLGCVLWTSGDTSARWRFTEHGKWSVARNFHGSRNRDWHSGHGLLHRQGKEGAPMPWYDFIWNNEPGGNVEHIAEHGLTPEDVEAVICNPLEKTTSRSSGRPVVTGYTPDGRLILVVYEEIDDVTVYPVTAYEVEE